MIAQAAVLGRVRIQAQKCSFILERGARHETIYRIKARVDPSFEVTLQLDVVFRHFELPALSATPMTRLGSE